MANKLKMIMRSEVREYTTSDATRAYKDGGSYVEEVLTRVTTTRPAALLECGYWRRNTGSGPDVCKSKKLACWECERIARSGANVEFNGRTQSA